MIVYGRDDPLLTNDGTNNSFKLLSADTIANGNEYPASSNTDPTITIVIMIVVIEGKLLASQTTTFSYILTNSNHST